MTPQDVFGIVVRTVGLLTLLWGVVALGSGAWVATEAIGIALIAGAFLLRGAPHLVDVAYPRKKTRRRIEAPNTRMQADRPMAGR